MTILKPISLLNKRVRIVYEIAAAETSLMILLIFMEPVYIRLFHGFWGRDGTLLNWTLSLDVHVLFAVPFLFLLIIQFMLAFRQTPGNLANKIHTLLGRFILLYSPIFLLITTWNVFVRVPNLLLQLTFYIIIINIISFLFRGYRAVKNKNYLTHMDSMLGAFVLSGIAATARLVYALYTLFIGHPPHPAFWLLISSAILYTKLSLIYALAGRLKQNINPLLVQIIPLIIIYIILPWP